MLITPYASSMPLRPTVGTQPLSRVTFGSATNQEAHKEQEPAPQQNVLVRMYQSAMAAIRRFFAWVGSWFSRSKPDQASPAMDLAKPPARDTLGASVPQPMEPPAVMPETKPLSPVESAHLAVTEALQKLSKKNLALIIHGTSFPADPDTGVGSPYGKGARKLLQFIKQLGFNGLQLGPSGKTKSVDASPYNSTSFSENPLFIDLAALTEDPAWAGLLSRETLDRIVAENPEKGVNRMAYDHIFVQQEEALKEVFGNFQKRRTTETTGPIADMSERFERFKTANAAWLEKDALYEALSTVHSNDYWPRWPNKLDKRLFAPADEAEAEQAKARIAEVKSQQAEVYERYQFTQFIASEQKEAFKTFATGLGMKLMADRQIAFSDRDVWAYQKLFLKGYSLGAPPDYFSTYGQKWGFSVLDPKQLFLPDGSLGEAGKLFKTMFDKMFRENPGGVRIDHIIGLIDPWVYPAGGSALPQGGAGRLHSSPEHGELAQYSFVGMENLNHDLGPEKEHRIQNISPEQRARYAALMRLVLQSAQEQGLCKDAIICEDLGTLTQPVVEVLEELGLSGMRVTQFVDPEKPDHLYRASNSAPQHWVMTGTHDNEPILSWVDGRFKKHETNPHAINLAEDLEPNPDHRDLFRHGLVENPKRFLAAKLAELFASPAANVQVFFTDLFGIRTPYNKPGENWEGNWLLRLPNDFEGAYNQALKNEEALNLPEALAMAMHARGMDGPQRRELAKLAQDLKEQ